MSDTPRTVAVCEKLIAWATKNPNATIGDAAKFIVETFTEDMAEVERELNEAQKTITEFREWSIGGVAASEWKNRAETAEAKLIAKPSVAGLVERLCMSKLFDAPELTAERKEAADALLSLSAQLAEKGAECEGLRNRFEAERSLVTRMWEASGLDPAYSIDDQFGRLRQDAERYRWLRKNGNSFYNCIHYQGVDEALDANVDAAIAERDCAVYKPLPKEVRDGILTLLTK